MINKKLSKPFKIKKLSFKKLNKKDKEEFMDFVIDHMADWRRSELVEALTDRYTNKDWDSWIEYWQEVKAVCGDDDDE